MTALAHSEGLLLALRQGDYSALHALADLLEEDGREDDSRLVREMATSDRRPLKHSHGASWRRSTCTDRLEDNRHALPEHVWDRLRGGYELILWRRYPSGHAAVVALAEALTH